MSDHHVRQHLNHELFYQSIWIYDSVAEQHNNRFVPGRATRATI